MKTPLIDIRPDHWAIVCDILQKHVPQYEVWAFGSRAKWMAKEYSDLDLAVITDQPLSLSVSAALADDFSESDLPWKVDVVDWATTSESFRRIIERDKVVVQEAKVGRVMAGEWNTHTLVELTINHDSKRKPVKEADRRPGPYPYYGASGIVDYVDDYLIDGDYLLIAEDGENLRTRQTPVAFIARGKSWVNNHAHIVTGNEKADTLFLMYAIQATDISGYLTGAVMPKLTQGNLSKIQIKCPDIDEQRAIAHILGTLDDKIELNRRMNETLEAIARTIFKSWFVDFDPVRAKASGEPPESICRRLGVTPDLLALFPDRLVDSELGEIPEGWATAPLYEMATYINGAAYRAFEPNEVQRGLPIIKIAELKAGVTAQTKYSDVDMLEKYRINRGDILFSWSGNPDTSIDTFVWTNGPAWLNQHIFRVVPPSELERSFVLAMLKYLRPVFAEIARDKQTTGLGHVTVSDLKRLKYVKPPKSLLVSWNEVIGPILERAFLSGVETQTLADHRDTLLPKLLSGEQRVPVAGAV